MPRVEGLDSEPPPLPPVGLGLLPPFGFWKATALGDEATMELADGGVRGSVGGGVDSSTSSLGEQTLVQTAASLQ